MKKIFLPLLSIVTVLLSAISCDKNGEEGPASEVRLAIEKVTSESLSFTVEAPGASLLTYRLLSENDAIPSADEILNSGVMADPDIYQVYVVKDLLPSTVYRIAAAAEYPDGSRSAVASVSAKTAEKEAIVPSVTLRDMTAGATTVSFTIVPDKAEEVFYLCVPSSEGMPSSDDVFGKGIPADPSKTDQYTVSGLFSSTEYTVCAVARSSDGTESEMASGKIATGEPEPVSAGDYYYSDGTWSSGDEEPLEDRECIGIVVLAGRSTVAVGDDDCIYYAKDGSTEMKEITGYVIALNDAVDGSQTEFAWGSWDVDGDSGAETSYDDSDFRGYYNTRQIKAKAYTKAGGLKNDPVDNYPAAYAAVVAYEKQVQAPETSTGWFLPSAQQLQYAYKNHDRIDASIDRLGTSATRIYRRDAIYWSSSEYWAQNGCRYWAHMVNLDEANATPGYISSQQKTKTYKVRSWLVF